MALQFPEIPVLYEDEDLLVINKPPGIVVNRSQTQFEPTIQDWVEERAGNFKSLISNFQKEVLTDSQKESLSIILGEPIQLFTERSGIVHRLDKDTSGVLLIAKNPAALIACMSQFKLRQTLKKYLALVHGKFQPQSGEINLPIGRNAKMRLQFAVREDGKASVTEYQVLEYHSRLDIEKVVANVETIDKPSLDFYSKETHGLPKNIRHAIKMYQGFSLVELTPKTGRTHQIRVHLSHLHHPIVGDKTYSGIKRRLIDQIWCPRIFLHAKSLKIVHPRTKAEIEFAAPLAVDLEKTLGMLSQ
ncbi:MAG: RluA family pseudouridine synthase [Patescibacteria group bacterium]